MSFIIYSGVDSLPAGRLDNGGPGQSIHFKKR